MKKGRGTFLLVIGCIALVEAISCGPLSSSSEQDFLDLSGKEDNENTDTNFQPWSPTEVVPGNLRIATFNIRNFPGDTEKLEQEDYTPPVAYQLTTDQEILLDVLAKLNFDLLAIQEIVDPQAFYNFLEQLSMSTNRNYDAIFSENPNDNPQHLGLVYDSEKLFIAWSEEHQEIGIWDGFHSGLVARVESIDPTGVSFTVMVVHLASGTSSKRADLRALQLEAIAALASSIRASTEDDDFIILGDFNTTLAEEELPQFDNLLGQTAGFARDESHLVCSAYWTKSARSPLARPGFLDHIYLSSLEERDGNVPLAVGAHCAEHFCEKFESTSDLNGGTFYAVSDHCPLYFEIKDIAID